MAVPFRSLRATLLVPFVLLILAVATGIYWVSYVAATRAVHEVSERLLDDVSGRVAQAVSQSLSSAAMVLNVAVPAEATRLDETTEMSFLMLNTVSPLEQRLWMASGADTDKPRSVYFASEAGRYIGVHRNALGTAEVRIRSRVDEPMRVYRADSADKRGDLLREEAYDPHAQPWYRAALEHRRLSWSPVYRDVSTGQLMVTLAKPVLRPDGGVRGVAATDVSFDQLTQFVRGLRVSENGVVFVAEPNGNLLASSADKDLTVTAGVGNGPMRRLNAETSASEMIRAAFAATKLDGSPVATPPRVRANAGRQDVIHTQFNTEFGETHVATTSYRDPAGLDLRLFVATPDRDFLGPLHENMTKGIAIGGAAALLALALGFWVLRRVANDVESVKRAAERLISGDGPITRIPERQDDIGALANSVAAIQSALLYDRLTGALNRNAFSRQFETIVSQLPLDEQVALIYIDLDRFKQVNDQFGHSVGDAVLAKSAERIRRRLRDNDLFARFGGDEFVVMIHGKQAVQSIDALVERLTERLKAGMTVETHSVSVGASIGVAIFPEDGDSLDELVRVADSRMYGEKRKVATIRSVKKTAPTIKRSV